MTYRYVRSVSVVVVRSVKDRDTVIRVPLPDDDDLIHLSTGKV
jgi:hypothetical protein